MSFDKQNLARWLLSQRMADPQGWVLSWEGPDAFGYPEATAYALMAATTYPSALDELDRVRLEQMAQALISSVHKRGGIGKNGSIYLFDSALAADALARLERSGTTARLQAAIRDALEILGRTIGRMLKQRAAVLGHNAVNRWSTRPGPHLLKIVRGAEAIPEKLRPTGFSNALRAMLTDLALDADLQCLLNGVAPDREVYTHALCYALEGLIGCGHAGLIDQPDLRGAAQMLATLQRPEGGVPSFIDPQAQPASDSTAQALRLWLLIDPERFSDNIESGLKFLESLNNGAAPRYTPQSSDRPSWSAVFLIQALAWREHGAIPAELI
ncbi:MAG: hypothetical protein P9M14_04585 [Candidatus Alcyoniella australis]|nr:hypothetical protein [Candidatus Alcyoniella australis]